MKQENSSFEILVEEYKDSRQEIYLRLQLQERIINYIFLVIVGVFSISQIFEGFTNEIVIGFQENPVFVQIMALLCLIFPSMFSEHNAMIATLANYQSDVLGPKINKIIEINSYTRTYSDWEKGKFSKSLRGFLKWDKYRAQMQFGKSLFIFRVMSLLRTIFVFFPALSLMSFFLYLKAQANNDISAVESVLIVIFLTGILGIVYMYLYAGQFYHGKA